MSARVAGRGGARDIAWRIVQAEDHKSRVSLVGAARRAAPTPASVVSGPDEGASLNALDMRLLMRVAVIGIFVILFIQFLDFGRPILLPLVSATIIAAVLAPLAKWAEQYHVHRVVFATIVVGLLLAVAYLGSMVMAEPIVEGIKNAPQIASALKTRLDDLQNSVIGLRYLQSLIADGAKLNVDFASFIKPVLTVLTPALGQLVVFFAALFLFLIDQEQMRHRLILVLPRREARLRAMYALRDIDVGLVRYLGAVTVINLGVGTITGIGLYLLQFPDPIFWGMAAFICNFVPYLGPAFIVVSLVLVSLITFPTLSYAILVAGLYIAMTTLEGHVVTPNVIGYNFRTSASAAFLSLAFWTWLWGPVGAFLSLPMLIVTSVALRWLLPAKRVKLPE
jgi:predicted PurR-regulated permease PerM